MNVEDITTPTLLVDQNVCHQNITKILANIGTSGCRLRPHFKSHQSHEVGRIYKERGITGITVSSLKMASFFAADGWDDITVAFPLNLREMTTVNALGEKISLNILVESKEHITGLKEKLKVPVGVFIKIDCGYGRTGIDVSNIDLIQSLLEDLKTVENARFGGFLTHAGNTYEVKGAEKVREIHSYVRSKMIKLKSKFLRDYPDHIISLGDTPSASLASNFNGIDEMRPGNFIYYDLAQHGIGSCQINEIAVKAACPIVAIHRERNSVVTLGGSIHLSKDSMTMENGEKGFGLLAIRVNEQWEILPSSNFVFSLSQEHGILHVDNDYLPNFKVGGLAYIIPVHACLTAHNIPETKFYSS